MFYKVEYVNMSLNNSCFKETRERQENSLF